MKPYGFVDCPFHPNPKKERRFAVMEIESQLEDGCEAYIEEGPEYDDTRDDVDFDAELLDLCKTRLGEDAMP